MNSKLNKSTLTDTDSTDRGAQVHIRHGAKALISMSTRILLIKEQHADGCSFWTFPGGGVNPDEPVCDGLVRELAEELHCRPLIDEAVTTVWYAHSSLQNTLSIYTIFECSLLSDPTPNRREGVLEYQWVSPTDLPPSTLPQVRYTLRKNNIL